MDWELEKEAGQRKIKSLRVEGEWRPSATKKKVHRGENSGGKKNSGSRNNQNTKNHTPKSSGEKKHDVNEKVATNRPTKGNACRTDKRKKGQRQVMTAKQTKKSRQKEPFGLTRTCFTGLTLGKGNKKAGGFRRYSKRACIGRELQCEGKTGSKNSGIDKTNSQSATRGEGEHRTFKVFGQCRKADTKGGQKKRPRNSPPS